jgi:hypothetical protein
MTGNILVEGLAGPMTVIGNTESEPERTTAQGKKPTKRAIGKNMLHRSKHPLHAAYAKAII